MRGELGKKLVLALGAGLERAQLAFAEAGRPDLTPPGRRVDVGGYSLHLVSSGQGSPTVILEPGRGGWSDDLAWIHAQVSRFTRVCSYDRAGLGWSDPAPEPLDLSHRVSQLHRLLDAAEVEGPYVLVGHSSGGLLVRGYARDFPDEVAGMVLIDSAHPGQEAIEPWTLKLFGRLVDQVGARLPLLGLLGLGWLPQMSVGLRKDLTLAQKARVSALGASPRNLAGTAAEVRQSREWLEEARTCGDLGDIPLQVLGAGVVSPRSMTHEAHRLQRELATLSTRGSFRIVPGSAHHSVCSDPRYAADVVEAIRDVVAAVREEIEELEADEYPRLH